MAGLPCLDLLGHPHVQQSGEQEVALHHDLLGTLGVQGRQRLGNRGTGHLDERRLDAGQVVLLPEHPREGVVRGIGVGHQGTPTHQDDGGVAGAPLLAPLPRGQRLGQTPVKGLAHPHVGQQRRGIGHSSVPTALVDGLGNVLTDVAAGVEHQRYGDGGDGLFPPGRLLGGVRRLGDGGLHRLGDLRLGELDEPQFHRDVGKLVRDPFGQGAALGHTRLVAGAVGGNDQRGSAGDLGVSHDHTSLSVSFPVVCAGRSVSGVVCAATSTRVLRAGGVAL